VILSWPSFHLVTIFRDRQVKSPQLIATTTQLTTALQELMSDQSAKSLTKTWLGTGKKVRKTKKVKIGDQVYLWFIAEGDDVATRHHAVITKVFQKSFQAECDDGSVWKQVLIELMRGPNCLNGVWQHMQNIDTDSDSDSDPDELPAAVEPAAVEPAAVEPAAVEPAAVSSDSDSDSSSSEEEEEIVEVVVVGRKKKRRFR
jgi:hypothetical protein